MALTGGLAANGKAAWPAMHTWADDVNKKGGSPAPGQLNVDYYDQTNLAMVPSLYTELIDPTKSDRWYRPTGTNLIGPRRRPSALEGMTMMGLVRRRGEQEFDDDRYSKIMPLGVESGHAIPTRLRGW